MYFGWEYTKREALSPIGGKRMTALNNEVSVKVDSWLETLGREQGEYYKRLRRNLDNASEAARDVFYRHFSHCSDIGEFSIVVL